MVPALAVNFVRRIFMRTPVNEIVRQCFKINLIAVSLGPKPSKSYRPHPLELVSHARQKSLVFLHCALNKYTVGVFPISLNDFAPSRAVIVYPIVPFIVKKD